MTKIVSKVFNYGDDKESSWPSQYGTGEKGVFHYDRETGEIREGYAPDPHPAQDTAPTVIFDSMPSTYHEKACRVIESRKEWERADRDHGSLTFGNIEEPRRHISRAQHEGEKEIKADRRRATKTALDVYRSNPREVRQKLDKEGEKQMEIAKKAGLKKLIKDAGITT